MQKESTKTVQRNGTYLSGMILAAAGLAVVLAMVIPAIAPLDNFRQVGLRLAGRAAPSAFGAILTVAGFGLMAAGSSGLEAISWQADGDEEEPRTLKCSCRAENPGDAVFCNQCGERLVSSPDNRADEQLPDSNPTEGKQPDTTRSP